MRISVWSSDVCSSYLAYRQAIRRRAALDSQSARLVAWGQRFGFVGRSAAQLDYLRRLQALAGSGTALWMLVEPGLSPQPSLDALAHRRARRGPPNVLTIEIGRASCRARGCQYV